VVRMVTYRTRRIAESAANSLSHKHLVGDI